MSVLTCERYSAELGTLGINRQRLSFIKRCDYLKCDVVDTKEKENEVLLILGAISRKTRL